MKEGEKEIIVGCNVVVFSNAHVINQKQGSGFNSLYGKDFMSLGFPPSSNCPMQL